jgi:Ni/Fe-hydrogenase subunit HybB-like protein
MESLPLFIGIAAGVLVVFWMVKKVFKFAFLAAIAGVAAWFWYFQIR